MKILVTGGGGFIGSNLCTKLLKNKNEVICLDNNEVGFNLSKLMPLPNFKFVKWNINNPLEDDIFSGVEQIYNLASQSSPSHFKMDSLETIETNTSGTLNIIKLGIKLNIPILHTSTIRIYETNHLNDNSCFTESKRMAETIMYEYNKKYNNPIYIARLGNIYGSGMAKKDSKFMPQIIQKAIRNENIEIWGDGNQFDSFCYIDDIVDVLIKYMNSGTNKIVLNISSLEKIKIKDIVDKVIDITKSKSKVVYPNINYINAKVTDFNRTEVTKELNWEPKIPINVGIKLTADWFKLIDKEKYDR